MTDRRKTYELIDRLSYMVAYGYSAAPMSLTTVAANDTLGFFVRDKLSDELLVPVRAGGLVRFTANNEGDTMAAFAGRIGTSSDEWINILTGREVTDLANVPTAALLQVLPDEQGSIEGLRLPDGTTEPFMVADGRISYLGVSYNRFEVAYRPPVNPAEVEGVNPDFSAKGGDNSPSAARGYTNTAYTFGVINFVPRDELANMLADDGVELDPDNDSHWSREHFRTLGMTARGLQLGSVQLQ